MLLKADYHRKDKEETPLPQEAILPRVLPRYDGWVMHENCMIFRIVCTLKV